MSKWLRGAELSAGLNHKGLVNCTGGVKASFHEHSVALTDHVLVKAAGRLE